VAPEPPVDDDTIERPAPMITPPAPATDEADPVVPDAVFSHPVEFRRGSVPVADRSIYRTADPVPPVPTEEPARRRRPRRRTVLAATGAAILVVALVIAGIVLLQVLPRDDAPTDTPGGDVEPVTNLSGVAIGDEVTFT